MNDYEKFDYLSDRENAMIRVMEESPEESLMRAYDEGYKMGIYKATAQLLSDVGRARDIVGDIKDIKKWEGEHG